MEITHLGHSSFKLRGKIATVVTDPFDQQMLGLKFPKIEADIVTVSHQHRDHNFIQAVEKTTLVIEGPGEYEAKGVKILGVAAYHDDKQGETRGINTVYRIEIDGISLVHCGDLGHKFSDSQLDILDSVDVLILPVGGYYTVSPQTAVEVVSQIEPKIIIPMHYATKNLSKEIATNLSDVTLFLREIGKEGIQPQPKLLITKEKLPTESIVVVLD